LSTPPTMTPRAFVEKWAHATAKESAASQQHFLDLCRLLGHPTPIEADPEGKTFTFEAGATKHSGGQGWADVWKRGAFAWEYKGKHADLDKAYDQLLQYREALENPPLLIVSDMDVIRIHTNFTNTVKQVIEVALEDLLDPAKRRVLHDAFFDSERLKSRQTPAQVTEQAATEFGRLAEQLRAYGDGYSNEQIAHFLIRLLFCLFAEDAGLLPESLFSKLIEHTRGQSKAFQRQLQQLFAAMRDGGWFGYDRILRFNGRLFDDDSALELDGAGMHTLDRISGLDWSSIEPSIFGTLFERSLDPGKRSQLGAHYTSREDILLIVEPVLMAPLHRRWSEVQTQAGDLAQKRDDATTPSLATRRQNELASHLQAFAREVAALEVLDPACGSGNFLYVALRLLLDLEKEVITLAGQLGCPTFFPSVSPEQLHGIEINPYAHELAQVTIWIGYIQWMQDNGFGFPSEPILKPLDAIRRMDAVLAYDGDGRPVEPEWPAADVIVGNPPFLGGYKLRSELGNAYVDDLFELYEARVAAPADLVCYWYEKARALVASGQARRAGLLATNAIRTGVNRLILERIRSTGDIFLAWSDRPWVLAGAAVRVSIVGFDNGTEQHRFLDGATVNEITVGLTSGVDVSTAQSLVENAGLVYKGMMKGGPFDISGTIAREMLANSGNPSGRPNSDVIRRRLSGTDIAKRDRDIWIIDFGQMSQEDASRFDSPFEYVRKHVKPIRDQNRRQSRRENWWLFGEPNPTLRDALRPLGRCIVTPEVSKYRLFVWMNTDVVPDYKLHVFARDDDYFFGVLQSRIHEVWSLALGSWRGAGNDPSYSSSRTFDTYPMPWPPGTEPSEAESPVVAAIAEAARELVAARQRWLHPGTLTASKLKQRTLTNLYNQAPTWLQLAHAKLDAAVLAAYGWPHELSDEEILARLLALNLERPAGEGKR